MDSIFSVPKYFVGLYVLDVTHMINSRVVKFLDKFPILILVVKICFGLLSLSSVYIYAYINLVVMAM